MTHNKPHILIIDNEDSFTWNLVQLFEECGARVTIFHPQLAVQSCLKEFSGIVISPGPGLPDEMNGLMQCIAQTVDSKPLLGICLGHQAIAMHFGAALYCMDRVVHGKNATISLRETNQGIFKGMPGEITVGLYHSWAVDPATLPDCLEKTAVSDEGIIMGIRHKTKPVYGLQFHPESFITEQGSDMIKQWLKIIM